MLNVTMPNVIMLNVIKSNVIMLNVIVLSVAAPKIRAKVCALKTIWTNSVKFCRKQVELKKFLKSVAKF
jgi:hypothetical protein